MHPPTCSKRRPAYTASPLTLCSREGAACRAEQQIFHLQPNTKAFYLNVVLRKTLLLTEREKL